MGEISMHDNNPRISIIIPAFQCEKYLNSCVKSVLNQKYNELEVIIIDDGSHDNTYEIALEWSKRDNRIRVFTQENSGVSSTRNRGIEEATGDYIMFLDADDEIINGLFDGVNDIVKRQEIDIVLWGYKCLLNREFLNEYDVVPTIQAGLYKKNNIEDIFWQLYDNNLFHNIGTKLYNRDLITKNNIRFKEGYSICEDALFCLSVLRMSRNMFVLNIPYYLYKLDINNNSLTKRYHKNYMECIKTLYSLIGDIVNPKGEEYIKHFGRTVGTLLTNELKSQDKKQNFNDMFDKIVNDKQLYTNLEAAYSLNQPNNKLLNCVLNGNKSGAYRRAMFSYKKKQILESKIVVSIFMELYRLYKLVIKRKRS